MAEGRARFWLSSLLRFGGRFEEAEEETKRSLILGLAAEDPVACGYAANLRGVLALRGLRFAESTDYLKNALDAFRLDGNQHGEAAALSNLARAQGELGEAASALDAAERVVAIYRDLGSGLRLGNGLYSMGVTLTATGAYDRALGCLTEALGIFRTVRQRLWEGLTLYRLGQLHLAAGSYRLSASHVEQALVVMRDIGGEWRTANALTVLGEALTGMGQPVRAHACWHDALATYTVLGSPEAAQVRRLLDGETAAEAGAEAAEEPGSAAGSAAAV
jgi:tetratricopeptide (TPR) repeat protein